MTPYTLKEDEDIVGGLIHYAMPWLLALVELLVGYIAYKLWSGGSALPWIAVALTVITGGLTFQGWLVAQQRRLGPAGRAHVAGTIALAGIWLLMATIMGPFTRGVIDTWLLLGLGVPISWNIRAALHRPGKSGEDSGPKTPRKAAKDLLASLGFKGATLEADEITEARIGGKLVLESGENTVDEVQKKAPQIATALGIPKSGVRFVENPDNAAEAEFSLTMRDVLTTPTPWPGPSFVGGTPFDPITIGLYETGKPMAKVVANKAGAKHEMQQGITGSGKSSGMRNEFADLMTRRQVALIGIDSDKGIQTFGPMAPGLALFIDTDNKAEAFLKRLRHVIKKRANYLGAHGLDAWQPNCGLTFLVVQIEEAGNLIARIGDDELGQLVKAARSAGIVIKISLQRPSHDEISTTVRSQFGGVACYGMHADDTVCMLPDEVLDAGARPQKWADRQPGCLYLVGAGITVAQAATPGRTYELTPERLAEHAAKWGPQMDPIDDVTAEALGDIWAKRIPPVELIARLKAEALKTDQSAQVKAPSTADGDDAESNTEEQDAPASVDAEGDGGMDETEELTPEDMAIETVDDAPDGTSMDDPIDPIDCEIVFGEAKPEVSPEEARAVLVERIDSYERDGREIIRVPDLVDLAAKVGGRSRAWFRKELLRLVKTGRLRDENAGVFRIIPKDEYSDGDQDETPAA